MAPPLILVADDEPAVVGQVRDALVQNGYRTICACNGIDAWNELVRHPDEVTACVVDLQMPPGSYGGRNLVASIRCSFSKLLPIVIYSGRGTISLAHEVTKAGADAFVEKEGGTQELVDVVARVISETPRSLAAIPSSLNELARNADLPALALKSFRNLEQLVRTRVISHYTPKNLLALFSAKGPTPSAQVTAKVNELTDFADEKKLAFGDLLELLAALAGRQLHQLPPPSAVRALSSQIVPVRNSLFHGRHVDTRSLVLAITSTEDLLDKLGRGI